VLAGHHPVATQRDQLSDRRAVAGDNKRLTMRDGIHDLPGPRSEIPLREFRCHITHPSTT
jgi:hypothetical protein